MLTINIDKNERLLKGIYNWIELKSQSGETYSNQASLAGFHLLNQIWLMEIHRVVLYNSNVRLVFVFLSPAISLKQSLYVRLNMTDEDIYLSMSVFWCDLISSAFHHLGLPTYPFAMLINSSPVLLFRHPRKKFTCYLI